MNGSQNLSSIVSVIQHKPAQLGGTTTSAQWPMDTNLCLGKAHAQGRYEGVTGQTQSPPNTCSYISHSLLPAEMTTNWRKIIIITIIITITMIIIILNGGTTNASPKHSHRNLSPTATAATTTKTTTTATTTIITTTVKPGRKLMDITLDKLETN